MKVPADSAAGVATIIGYFLLKITLIITGAAMTQISGNGWWVVLIFAALLF